MRVDSIKVSFAGGEVSPELLGRFDLDKYQNGLSLCRNMIVTPQGPVMSRANFQSVVPCFGNDAVLVPFVFSAYDWCLLEFGHCVMRVHATAGSVLREAVGIDGLANAAGVMSIKASGLTAGDDVYLSGCEFPVLDGRRLRARDALNCGPGYFRLFDEQGAAVPWSAPSGTGAVGQLARVYQIATPYSDDDISELRHSQRNDVLTLLHPRFPVVTLARHAMTDWRLLEEIFAPRVKSVSGKTLCVVANAGTNTQTYSYAVTAVSDDGREESLPSLPNTLAATNVTGATHTATLENIAGFGVVYGFSPIVFTCALSPAVLDVLLVGGFTGQLAHLNNTECVISEVLSSTTFKLTDSAGNSVRINANVNNIDPAPLSAGAVFAKVGVSCNLSTANSSITVTWNSVDGISMYNIYRSQGGGLYGYVGKAATTRFVDRNIIADVSRTPPTAPVIFAEANDYPQASCYYQQRKFFASTVNRPQSVWSTRPGTEANMSASFPLRADDALSLAIEAIGNTRIQHILPLRDLLVLTDSCEAVIDGGGNDGAITATTASIKVQSYIGASRVPPALLGSSALFVDRSGKSLIEMAWRGAEGSYGTNNISVMAGHLLESGVTSMAAAPGHLPMALMTTGDGRLIALTYMPEHKVLSFHQHAITGALVRQVCTVSASNGVKAFIVAERGGKLFIEMADWAALPAACLDGALHYQGAPTNTIGGLYALANGTLLDVVADGVPHRAVAVSNGSVTLDAEFSDVWLGYAYEGEVRTLPQVVQGDAAGGVRLKKKPVSVQLRVRGDGAFVGQEGQSLHNFVLRTDGALDNEHNEIRNIDCSLTGGWDLDMNLIIKQATTLPLTVYSMAVNYAVSGN